MCIRNINKVPSGIRRLQILWLHFNAYRLSLTLCPFLSHTCLMAIFIFKAFNDEFGPFRSHAYAHGLCQDVDPSHRACCGVLLICTCTVHGSEDSSSSGCPTQVVQMPHTSSSHRYHEHVDAFSLLLAGLLIYTHSFMIRLTSILLKAVESSILVLQV